MLHYPITNRKISYHYSTNNKHYLTNRIHIRASTLPCFPLIQLDVVFQVLQSGDSSFGPFSCFHQVHGLGSIKMLKRFLELVATDLKIDVVDIWKWKLEDSGKYSVVLAYSFIQQPQQTMNDQFFRLLQRVFAPPLVLHFACRASIDRLLTTPDII